MSLNDFDHVPDPLAKPQGPGDEEFTGAENVQNLVQVDVSRILEAKQAVEKAVDAANDAAASVGYEIGVAAEQARIVNVIEHLKGQAQGNEGVTKLLEVLTDLITKEEDGKVVTE